MLRCKRIFPVCLLISIVAAHPPPAASQTKLESLTASDIVANPPSGIFQSTGGVVASTRAGEYYDVTGITRQQSGIGQTTLWVQITPADQPDAKPLGWVPYSASDGDFLLTEPPAAPGDYGVTTRSILEMSQ